MFEKFKGDKGLERKLEKAWREYRRYYNLIGEIGMKLNNGVHPKQVYYTYEPFFVQNCDPDDVVLDLGSGFSFLANFLAKKVKKVICIDKNPKNIEVAQKRCDQPNIEWICKDIEEDISINEQYTVCIMSQILEHVHEPVKLLKQIKCPKLIIGVPSEEDWIIQTLIKAGISHFRDDDHKREYTRESLRKELERAYFKAVKMEFSNLAAIQCVAIKDNSLE